MTQPIKKPDLHQSQLSMLSRCGMQFEFRYVQNLVLPPAVAPLVGTATHKGIEANLGQKIADGTLLAREAVIEIATTHLKGEWGRQGVVLNDEEKAEGERKVKDDAIDTVASLSDLHAREMAPGLKPTHVERTFRLELKGYPVNLAGTIDIIESPEPTKVVVRDTKTSKRSPSEDVADRSEQLSVYALAVQALDGKPPDKVTLDYLVKTKVPKVVVVESERGPIDIQATLLRVEKAVKLIEAGAFYPTNPDSWWCSKNFCGYWSRCAFGERKRVQV